MCLPNINLIFNNVVLEGETKDKLKIQLNLSRFRSLRYTCPASKKRNDFFYYEPDNDQNLTETSNNDKF
uniref:Uncharacterized protein n=1 Tax=Romanomermis culicivorax TaxID=13658 RepID=A0A915L6X8_ROMCU